MSDPKYPDVMVKLSGRNSNAFFIIGRVSGALKRAGVPADEVKQFSDEAMSGDYDNVLRTCMRWVNVE